MANTTRDVGRDRARGMRRLVIAVVIAVVLIPVAGQAASERKEAIRNLPERWRVWLQEEVYPLISRQQEEAFLDLETEAQRQAFVERLWDLWGRQSGWGSAFRSMYQERLAIARSEYVSTAEDRARVLLLHGPPDGIVESKCPDILEPLEIWVYQYIEGLGEGVVVLFYQQGGLGTYRMWQTYESRQVLYTFTGWSMLSRGGYNQYDRPELRCFNGEQILRLIAAAQQWMRDPKLLRSMYHMEVRGREGAESSSRRFMEFSALLPDNAEPLDFSVKETPRGARGGMVRVGFDVDLPAKDLGTSEVGDVDVIQIDVVGEISRESSMVDRFRYLFSVPAGGDTVGLSMERFVRPGDYTVRLKLEDVHSKKAGVEELQFTAEPGEGDQGSPLSLVEGRLPEAAEELAGDPSAGGGDEDRVLKLVGPAGEALSGVQRFEAVVKPAVARVRFLIDGEEVLTKNLPPFDIDLDLGPLPRLTTVTAVAYGDDGTELARQSISLNVGKERFYVRLLPLSPESTSGDQTRVEVEVNTPTEARLDRLEIYWNDRLLKTLTGPPYEASVSLHGGAEFGYLRALAVLQDGRQAEDIQFVNAPEFGSVVDVTAVELPVTVLDRAGKPVKDLEQDDFTVFENGVEQEISHFALHEDLPVRLGLLLDTSGSMEEMLPTVQRVVMGFLRDLLRPRDRAYIETFSDRPDILATFTADFATLENALLALYADRTTALYDAVITGLFQYSGVRGRKAMVLLTDGEDTASNYSYDEVISYAQRSGVTIYTIGIDLPMTKVLTRFQLKKLAEVTGGRAFFIDEDSELDRIYGEIDRELRSQYLLAYTSSSEEPPDELRKVKVEVDRRGVDVRTISGYYPVRQGS